MLVFKMLDYEAIKRRGEIRMAIRFYFAQLLSSLFMFYIVHIVQLAGLIIAIVCNS